MEAKKPTLPLPERERSLVHDFESEWRKRPVNVMKIFRSMVTQLTEGADLTRITMPSEICHPFSILEVIAGRELASFRTMFDIHNHPNDPFERFLCVTRWLLSCFPREEMEKKPFNPTIGEQHLGWIEHANANDKLKQSADDGGGEKRADWTEMIAEQVSHHPPLSAFFVRNAARELSLAGTLDFQVSFGGANHVNITSGGSAIVKTPFENYALSKLVPNLTIQRVIFGEKYYMWMGPLILEAQSQSPEHAYRLELQFSEKNETTNQVKGTISLKGEALYHLSGAVGRVIHFWKAEMKDSKGIKQAAKSSSGKKAQVVLFDFAKYLRDDSNVKYPAPECRVKMNSLRVWKEVADAVIIDDMTSADNAKRQVEHEQRLREKKREVEGAAYGGVYFEQRKVNDALQWFPKDGIQLSPEYLESLKEIVAKQNEEDKERVAQELQHGNHTMSQPSPIELQKKPSDLSRSKSQTQPQPIDGKKEKSSLRSSNHKASSSAGDPSSVSPGRTDDENCLIS